MAEVRVGFTSFNFVVTGQLDPPPPGAGLEAGPIPGGQCVVMKPTNPAAMALNDAVSIDSANAWQCKKDRTMQFIGFLVGSTPKPDRLVPSSGAGVGNYALVQIDGIALASVDNSAIVPGSPLKLSGATDGILTLDGAPSVIGTVAYALEPNNSQAGTIKVKIIQ